MSLRLRDIWGLQVEKAKCMWCEVSKTGQYCNARSGPLKLHHLGKKGLVGRLVSCKKKLIYNIIKRSRTEVDEKQSLGCQHIICFILKFTRNYKVKQVQWNGLTRKEMIIDIYTMKSHIIPWPQSSFVFEINIVGYFYF